MEKSFKILLILLAFLMLIGFLNVVSASGDIHQDVVLEDSSLSSGFLDDIASVNDNVKNKIYVSNYGDDFLGDGSINAPYGSLSQGINKSENGSIIYLNGSFIGEINRNLIIDKDLSIISLSGTSYINGESNGRIFNVLPDCTLSIEGLSFTLCDVSNLDNSDGGVIYSEGNLFINNCEFNKNTANNGGCIYSKGKLVVNNSLFYENLAIAFGGSIYSLGDNSLVNNSVFRMNGAKSKTTKVSGGAICNYGKNFTVFNSLFNGNYARETSKVKNDPIYGGAISNYGAGFYVFDCEFISNYVEIRTDAGSGEVCLNTAYGGAIYTVAGAKIENSRFEKNTAHCRYSNNYVEIYGNKCAGGSIYIESGNGFYLLNNTFSNCSSAYGVIKNKANNAVFENNTFDNDKSMFMGSAIYDSGENSHYIGNTFLNHNDTKNHAQGTVYVQAANVTFENNVFLDNYDTSGSTHSTNNAAIYIYNPSFRGGSDAGDTNIRISNNVFDGNDRGIYLYCSGGTEISNNIFINQKQQAIDTYVGRDVSILNNYFENNHGYHGAVDINSYNTLIKANTFVNNSGTVGGAIGNLCRDGIAIESNIFMNNHAKEGGGDIYLLYGESTVSDNTFVVNSIYGDESSIFAEYGKINAINNEFNIYNNLHKIINQVSQLESYLNNIINDYTPINKDGTVTNSTIEDLVSNHKRTLDDFKYNRNATENNADLEDSTSNSSNTGSKSNPIEDIIEDIIDVVDDVVNGSGESMSNGSSISGGKTDSLGSSTNSSSTVGKYPKVNQDYSSEVNSQQSPASSDDSSSQESRENAYDLSEKNQGITTNSINQIFILIVILVILLIYGFYKGRNDI